MRRAAILRIAAFDGIDSLNPFVGVNDDSYAAYEYIYPQLVQYDANLQFVARLRDAWNHVERRPHVDVPPAAEREWSDGQPLTAKRRRLDLQHDHQVPGRLDRQRRRAPSST